MAGWTSMRQYEPSSIPAESLKFELELYFFCPRFPLSYREPISFLDDRRLWDERMSHFSTETLLDFARGLLPSPKADEVNHHLEGCVATLWAKGGSSILVMGQILNADKPDQRVKDFRVLLLRGKRITAQTNSSPLGEFRFELADAKNWKLLFEVEGREVIPISLPELT